MAELIIFMVAWIFRTFGPRIAVYVFGGEGHNRGRRDGAMLVPTNLFLPLGVVTSVPLLAKIDEEMRP